jgi:putative methyltransferase (TIGR04325 family)
MNAALDRYADDERVISVHGYVYPTNQTLPEAFFLRGADCWGWATWRRGWMHFNADGQFLLDEIKRQKLLKAFDLNGAYGFSKMLKEQISGGNDSWAVRWHASAFLANKLTLYPGRSLVHNIGNDSSGTHCGESTALDTQLSATPIRLTDVVVEESEAAKKAIEDFFRVKRAPLQRLFARFIPENMRYRLIVAAKNWLPPVLVRQLRRISRLGGGISFEGPFESWEEAQQRSSGYDDEQILEKVLAATLKVKRGEAVFERDSVLFDEIQYAWPVTAGLMWAAARNDGRLSVLDFGGSLGSSYFQNRKFLEGLRNVRWSVVEQSHFVEAGRKYIQNEHLVFYPTIAECVVVEKPNVVLLSSVIEYLENYQKILQELIDIKCSVLIIDRSPFGLSGEDMHYVQRVPSEIFAATLPFTVIDEQNFIIQFKANEYNNYCGFNSIGSGYGKFKYKGYLFMREFSE